MVSIEIMKHHGTFFIRGVFPSLSIYSYWYQRLGGEILRQNSRLGGQLMGRHDGLMASRGHVVHHFSWTDMVQSYILNEFHHWLVVWKMFYFPIY